LEEEEEDDDDEGVTQEARQLLPFSISGVAALLPTCIHKITIFRSACLCGGAQLYSYVQASVHACVEFWVWLHYAQVCT
jgi:hypothetical protein